MRAILALIFVATAASAAAQPKPAPQLTAGKVESVSPTRIAILSQGKTVGFAVSRKVQVIASHPGTLADIRPGSFIGTTNTPTGAASGSSTEVHVFPPGVKLGEGDRPMGPVPGGRQAGGARMTNGTVRMAASRMTNGSVGSVAKNGGGLAFDVDYGQGRRHIVVGLNTPIVVMTTVPLSAVKPGMSVLVGAVTEADGSKTATFINLPPPQR